MRFNLRSFVFFVISVNILCSCGDGKPEEGAVVSDSTSSKDPHIDSNDLRVFTLPAPLQVATLLRIEGVDYNERILIPSKKANAIYASNYLRALNLGMYTIDLGYATVYDQHQMALNYVKIMESLVQDLGISSGISGQTVRRFENNIRKPDSLYHIILESYSQANEYFQTNKREELGMYILSGSYIEGLYIALNYNEIPASKVLRNLIGQQKLFLENIIELLQYTEEKPETVDLLVKLMSIKEEFNAINVLYDDSGKGKIAVKCSVDRHQLTSLLKKVVEVRSKIINS
ncbi:MAG: hypothetical protein JNL63_09025 [Bacteroidia bacterium]|nr:hypothetical protein [Bacteroidia bacterium]